MLISTREVSEILLNGMSQPGVVYVSDWVGDGKVDVKTFVVSKGGYFRGEVTKTTASEYTALSSKINSVFGKREAKVTYSHESNSEMELVEVHAEGVKENGKRIVVYV